MQLYNIKVHKKDGCYYVCESDIHRALEKEEEIFYVDSIGGGAGVAQAPQ